MLFFEDTYGCLVGFGLGLQVMKTSPLMMLVLHGSLLLTCIFLLRGTSFTFKYLKTILEFQGK